MIFFAGFCLSGVSFTHASRQLVVLGWAASLSCYGVGWGLGVLISHYSEWAP